MVILYHYLVIKLYNYCTMQLTFHLDKTLTNLKQQAVMKLMILIFWCLKKHLTFDKSFMPTNQKTPHRCKGFII